MQTPKTTKHLHTLWIEIDKRANIKRPNMKAIFIFTLYVICLTSVNAIKCYACDNPCNGKGTERTCNPREDSCFTSTAGKCL